MRICILSMCPEMLSGFDKNPIVHRALESNVLEFETCDIKAHTKGSFRKIDDSPCGGGKGMILRVDALCNALSSVLTDKSHVVLLSPKGSVFTQKKAKELAQYEDLVFVCGHYEGVDARFEEYADEMISLGDFVLSGGENAALAICDSIVRLLPGVLKAGVTDDESFEKELLEYSQYTHPAEFKGKKVPEVLLSGDDARISLYRECSSLMETAKYRPELLFKSGCKDKTGKSAANVLFFDKTVMKIESNEDSLLREKQVGEWLFNKLPVAKVLGFHSSEKAFLLTEKLKGRMLCDEYYLNNPHLLLKFAAEGLKSLWQVDVSDCPFCASADEKLKLAGQNIRNGTADFTEAGDFDSPESLFKWLVSHKPEADTVFSHGDFCLPNVIVSSKGISGFVDLGLAGAGDRFCDIALCLRSIKDNANGKYDGVKHFDFDESMFFDMLEIAPDYDKIRWYTLLDELF